MWPCQQKRLIKEETLEQIINEDLCQKIPNENDPMLLDWHSKSIKEEFQSKKELINYYVKNVSISEIKQKYDDFIVDRHSSLTLSYNRFIKDYVLKNKPVLITDICKNWRCFKEWIESSDDDILKVDKFKNASINEIVNVTNNDKICNGCFLIEDMMLYDYLNWFNMNKDERKGLKYLKDWHCAYTNKDNKFYELPVYFSDDWLNEYYDNMENEDKSQSDYRFVYLGIEGTWTPFHTDVLKSYSWSINVTGEKKWYLLAPELSYLLYDKTVTNIISDIKCDHLKHDYNYPFIKELRNSCIEINQSVDEALFVPSGWYHCVYNTKDTLSINHNWINRYNLHWLWRIIERTHFQATHDIEDCRELCKTREEFEELVQRNLKIECGMNFGDVINFLKFVINKEIKNNNHIERKIGLRNIKYILREIINYLSEMKLVVNDMLIDIINLSEDVNLNCGTTNKLNK